MRKMNSSLGYKQTAGAALVIALVLLAAVTIIGIANMQSATLETKMIASQKQRNANFAIAESGLSAVELYLHDELDLKQTDLTSDACRSNRCFTNPCTKGLCFDGEYVDSDTSNADCEVATNAGTTAREKLWESATTWNDDTLHGTRSVKSGQEEVKYIIEFLCYAGADFATDAEASDPIFRISVFYEPSSHGQPILLQSMYSFNVPII